MSTRTIRIFAVAIALYAACTAFGQKTPGHELGVRPNRLYEFDNIDTINLLNGNLMIAVPIGAAAPVGPQLGLQLKLVYNSKVWDYEVIFDPNQATPDITGHPNHRSNAGLGWRLSLGQLLPPNDSTLEYENRLTWVYEGPSGDENLFHRNFPGEASTAGTDAVMFSPAARLRLRTISPIEREVDFPSGEIHTFIKAASGQWLLVKQRDRFGNSIDIYHRYDSSGKESYWEITDSKHEPNSKTVIVHFQDVDESSLSDTTWRGRIVESVEVRTFGTTTKAKYEFKYTYIAVPPACGDTETGSGPARTTTLPFLTSVKQPDGTSYTFDYHRTVTECEQGALKQMNLPSGGALGYTYRTYQIQFDRCSTAPWYNQPVGIATKTASDDSTIDANDKAQWTYVPSAGAQLDLYHPPDRRFDQQCGTEMETTEDPSWVNKLPIEPRRWIRTTVLSPAVATDATGILRRRRTDHYFDAWPTVGETRGDPNFQHDLAREFGSPGVVAAPSVTDNATGIFPRDAEGPDVAAADADGRLLLRRVFADCADSVTGVCTSVAPGSGRLIRSEYGQSAYAAQYLGPDRDLSSRTVFEDDTSCGGVCSVTTTNTDWNTAGQNRTTTVVSTILGTPTRESTTQYPDWTAPQLRDLLTPWIFTTYASSTQKETAADGTVSEATETTCFSATGFLERKRISRSGGNDILAVYEDADAAGTTDGYVSAEKYYGGDDPAASAVPASFNTCSGNVTTFSPRYVLRHEYSYGVRSRTRYDGATFNVLDRTVDPTGLVSISRDANGRKTFFTYDVMGRLRRLLPPAAAWTKLDYDLTVTPRKVTVAQYAADDPDATIPLTEMRAYYDGMGRLLQDRKRLPGVDAWSVSTHQYDVMGRKIFASVPVKSGSGEYGTPPSTGTTFVYDYADRITRVTEADGSTVSTQYDGLHAATRTVMVATPTATAQTGQEPVSTREQYDGNGRLIAVEEPSAPSGTAVRTEYDYDVGGRLTKASTGVQLRTFVYDAAGLLAAEHHPESGDTTYRYDARGHVVDKKIGTTVHLQFTYDAAERLTKVFDALSSRALKTLAYDSVPELTPSLPAHSEPGALLRQTRVNVLPDALGQYDVTDDFRYDDAGRPASKTTLVATSGAGSHTFQQTYTYTGLGSPAAANFPLCLTPCGALALTPRNIPLTYDNGFLTAVDGVTGSLEPDDGGPAGISYTPAGTVWRVKHAQGNGTGVVDKYDTNLVTNLPRIASIEFSGTRECDLITNEMPSDTLIRAGTPATLSVTASPGAVITWYKGRRGDASQTVGTGAAVTVSPAADTEYWARASLTGATCSDSTSTLTVRVCKPVAILSAFQNDVGRVNERKVFSVAAEGVNLSFAWSAYKCQDGNCTGTSVSLGTGPTVEWVPTVAATYKIRVTVTSEFCESSASAEFNVVVEAQLPDCTAKWSAPLDDKTFVLAPGDGVLLRVALQAIPNASKYQFIWYENGVVAKTDPPVSNTSPTTDPPANPPVSNTSTFELFVGSKDKVVSVDAYVQCGDNTKSATLRSTTFATDLSRCARPAVTVAPLSVALSADRQTAQIAVVSEEPRLKYQWYRGESGNTSRPVSSATFAALMVPFAADTYWVRVTAECGAFTDSPTVVVSTENCGPVRLLQEPQEQTVTARTPVQLSVDASSTPGGGPLNPLQWFANGVETGATGFAYTVRPLRTTDYKVAVSNSCHTTWSRVARIHVTSCSEIEIIRQPADVIMAEPVSVTLTVAAAQSGVIYQWYSGESGDVTMPIANGTGPSLLVPPGTAPAAIRKFWARVSFGDPNRCAVDSRTALVKVCPPLSVAGVADPTATVELRSTAPLLRQVLDANVQGVDLSYEWFSGTAVVENKRLAATTSYLPVRPAETENFCVRVTSGCTSEQLLRKFRVSVCGTIGVPEADRTVVMRGSNVHLSVNTTNADKVEWFSSQPDGSDVSFVGLGNVVDAVVTERRAFWARASNGTCSVESTRIEVKLCIPPKITWSMNIATQVQSDVTQTLSFDIAEPLDWTSGNSPAPDNTHTTSWYEGRSGDVSKPLSTQESFVVHPAATTWYWVRVITPKGCFTNLEIKIEVCRPLIASQPATRTIIDKIANPAASALLAVVANGGPLTYDWYVGQSGDTSNPVLNQHSDKLTVSPTTDTSYWVRVKGDCGTVDSTTAAVVVCVKPQITGAPANQTGTSGFRAALSVTATGTDLTYRWYKGASGDTSSPLAETGTSLTFTATETADYWVRVSGACGAADSPAAKVSVAPAITSQPAGGWVMPGQTRTLQVAATGLPLSYQWYTKSGTTETTVGGATTNSYTPPPPAVTTNFFCRVISGNASTDSSVATINVCSPPALSWASNITTKVRPSFSQVLSVTGAGVDATTPHTNQWYVKNPDGTWTPAATQETYSIAPPATTTYKVRVTFTSTGCYSEASITISVCVPVITTQPAASTLLDKTTDPAATAQLRVAADLGPHRFQWYIGQPGVTTTPAANGTTDTLTVSPTADTTYWVRVTTVECGVSVDSNAATVVLCKSPAITQQPPTVVTTTAGTAATLSVNASGTTLTYRWYIGSSGDISTPVANATGSTYSPAPTVTTDYWVKVSGQCGSVNSTTSKVSVAPAITTQPASASITSGTSRTLTVAASGTQLTYQWYSVVNGTGTSISGATSTSYTTPALTASASYYVKVISGGAASTQSSTATVTVCQPGTVTWSGSSVSGTTHTLSIVSPVAGETYDWYMGATGNTASYVGTGTSVVVSPTQTTTYWARFKRSTCTADSATVTVTICTPRIVTQPVGETVDPGASRTLSVSATGNPPLTYQWYVGTSGVTTSPVSGATNPTYTTPAVSSTTSYWVRVTSPANCGTYVVDSVTATLTVCRKPTISQQPFSINIEPGTGTTLSVTATGDGLSYQWYEGAVGVTTKPVGTNSRTFTVAPAATTSYWVRVSGTCGTADSTLAKVSIYPVITTHPVGGGVCDVGQNVTLSVAATGSQLVYRWCSRTDTTEWSVLPQTGPQITVAVTSTPMYFQSEVSSGDALRVSDPAGFVLNEKPFIQTINVFRVYTGTYRLEAIVASSDTLPLSYAWYQGPVGNVASSTYLTSTYYVQVSPRPPVTYWVRVTNADTGCYSDRAYSF